MKGKEFLMRKRGGATFLNIAVLCLAVAELIVYLQYANAGEGLFVPWVLVLLLFVILSEIALFFFDNDYLPIAVAGLSMLALGLFAQTPPETLGSIADYYQNIVMFGDPQNFGIIVANFVLMLVMSVTAIVSGFFRREK